MHKCKFCDNEIKELRKVYCETFLYGVICCVNCHTRGMKEAAKTDESKKDMKERDEKREAWQNQINKKSC